MGANLIRKDEAVNLIRTLDDAGVRDVLVDTLTCLVEHHDNAADRSTNPIDISFIVLTLKRVLDDQAVYDVLRGDIDKHDWFEDGNGSTGEASGGHIQGTGDGPWGLRHSQAAAYIDSLSDAVIRNVLCLVLAKAVMLQIFEKIRPGVKLDLLFLVESLGQALLSRQKLLNAWKNLAS